MIDTSGDVMGSIYISPAVREKYPEAYKQVCDFAETHKKMKLVPQPEPGEISFHYVVNDSNIFEEWKDEWRRFLVPYAGLDAQIYFEATSLYLHLGQLTSTNGYISWGGSTLRIETSTTVPMGFTAKNVLEAGFKNVVYDLSDPTDFSFAWYSLMGIGLSKKETKQFVNRIKDERDGYVFSNLTDIERIRRFANGEDL